LMYTKKIAEYLGVHYTKVNKTIKVSKMIKFNEIGPPQ